MITTALIFANLFLAQAAPVAPSLDGSYQRPCYIVDTDALTTELTIQNDQWKLQNYAFEDEKCATPYLIYEVDYKVKTAGDSSNAADMTVVEASYVALSDQVADALNYVTYCGFSDWKKNEKRVVSGLQCEDFHAPAAGSMIYSILKTESKDAKTALYMGTESGSADGKSTSSRYTAYDSLPLFKK